MLVCMWTLHEDVHVGVHADAAACGCMGMFTYCACGWMLMLVCMWTLDEDVHACTPSLLVIYILFYCSSLIFFLVIFVSSESIVIKSSNRDSSNQNFHLFPSFLFKCYYHNGDC
jgi:hypothetical protein